MRVRNTLLLLLVLIGLGVYVINVERPAAVREATKEKLLDFKVDEVTEMVLTSPDREVVLVKADGVWKITKPLSAEADDAAVKGILSVLSTAEVKKGLDGEVKDLSTYGLEKPNTTVTLKAGATTLPAVKMGDAAPIGASAYALRGDDGKVLLTTSSVRAGVDKSLKDLRGKTILRFTDDAVRKVEVKGEGRDLVLAKGDGEAWKIESPAPLPADTATVRTYLSTLRSLRALDFPDEAAALSTYGLDAPRLSVNVTLADGAVQTLLVGGSNDKKEVYVKTAASPVVYTVGEYVGKDLEKPVDDFRDKTVLALDKEKIKSIEVTRRDAPPYTIARGADGKWTLEPAEKPAAQNPLTAFVNDVAGLKGYAIAADEVTDLGAYGLDPPAVKLKVTGTDGAEIGTILLAIRPGDGKREYYALRAGGRTVLTVRDTQYVRLDKGPSDFAEKPAAVPPAPGIDIPPGGSMPGEVDLGGGDFDEGDLEGGGEEEE